MKKCYSLLRCLYIAGCAQQTFTVQNKPAAKFKGNYHPSFLRFWNWAEENCRCSQNLYAAENVVKTETQQISKWIARFYYFLRHLYSAGSAHEPHLDRVGSSIWATLSALLINILLGSSSCFCIVIASLR